MLILTQFINRLSFGLALAMAITPSRKVSSGYFRNNLYVMLGLNVLVTLVAWNEGEGSGRSTSHLGLATAILSYVGAAVWLYESRRLGTTLLYLISFLNLLSCWLTVRHSDHAILAEQWTSRLDPLVSGLLLGSTLAAMLLGHWYLNSPGMQLAPLVRLVGLMAFALGARATVCGVELGLRLATHGMPNFFTWMLIAMQWIVGIGGTAVVALMTWRTLKVPNTQSATGILYVGVIATFAGELAGQLLVGLTN